MQLRHFREELPSHEVCFFFVLALLLSSLLSNNATKKPSVPSKKASAHIRSLCTIVEITVFNKRSGICSSSARSSYKKSKETLNEKSSTRPQLSAFSLNIPETRVSPVRTSLSCPSRIGRPRRFQPGNGS
jgi:hypothetical protein